MTIQLLEGIILLASLVVLSNIINHYFSSLPTSLIQIGFGFLLAFFFKIQIPLQTDWFLLLFVAPILFNDARTFPKKELWELKTPIIGNAILLVFLTTFIGGALFHFLIPTLPLAASFALAAILSPTDPVAVNSITEQAKLPPWIMHLVAGESLINDASGLIGFKYGVAATVTGAFSLLEASTDFVYISIVGALVGFLLTITIRKIRQFLISKGFDDVTILAVIQFLTPFVIYIIAEEVHASGVIAVVVAGLLTNLNKRHYLEEDPKYLLVTNSSWEIIVYLLDGVIFLILGIELPFAMQEVVKNPYINTFSAIGLVFAIWFFLFLIRIVWIYGTNLIQHRFKQIQRISLRDAILSGLTGVRGAITMAGVLSLPMMINTGAAFPHRSLLLFLASGVILLSLLTAVIFIPLLTKTTLVLHLNELETADTDAVEINENELDERQAKSYLYTVAINAVESRRRESENNLAALDVINEYQNLLRRLDESPTLNDEDQVQALFLDELQLRRVGLRGEASKLEELKMNGFLTPELYRYENERLQTAFSILTNLQLGKEVGQVRGLGYRMQHFFARFKETILKRFYRKKEDDQTTWVEKEMAKNAINFISDFVKEQNKENHQMNRRMIYHQIIHYRRRIANLKNQTYAKNDLYDEQVNQLRVVAFAAQRTAIVDLVEQDRIAIKLAIQLREEINFAENTLLLANETDE